MKTLFILLLLATIGVAYGWQYFQLKQKPAMALGTADLTRRARELAMGAKDAVITKAAEWKLKPDQIKTELQQTGRVVRTRAIEVGERMDDLRIVTVIKGKYVVEQNLSSSDLGVECTDGEVKLTGTLPTAGQVGQAIGLALQTTGVHRVVSELSVRS